VLIGKFLGVQTIVQALGFLVGLIVVRHLSKQEYAHFTVANSLQGTMNILADTGVATALSAIGGRVWQQQPRLDSPCLAVHPRQHRRRRADLQHLQPAARAGLECVPFLEWLPRTPRGNRERGAFGLGMNLTPLHGRRPLALRLLRSAWRERVYFRFFRDRHERWRQLFAAAPLHLCPAVSMYDLMPSDVISGLIAFTGSYETALSQRVAVAASRGGLLVDVGANMGYFSLLWAGVRATNRAVAIEASPRNVRLLRQNVERNGLTDRVSVLALAAGDHTGMVSFDPGPDEQTGWGGISISETATSFTVPMVRLDEQLPDAEIELLKIDVEGADTLVLLGCAGLFQRQKVRTVFFEQNPERMDRLGLAPKTARTLLGDCGYTCVPLDPLESEWMATRRGRD
jgi:FkbM family methyltransferase